MRKDTLTKLSSWMDVIIITSGFYFLLFTDETLIGFGFIIMGTLYRIEGKIGRLR